MATRKVRRKVRRGKKTKRARRSGRGKKTKRARHSGRGGLSPSEMYSTLIKLKKIQHSVMKNSTDFITREMRRIKRPIISAMTKFDGTSGDLRLRDIRSKHLEGIHKDIEQSERDTSTMLPLSRMPSGEHTQGDTKQ